MKPKLYLHIGTHKTGSSAIQAFLARHRSELNVAGFCYPLAGCPHRGEGSTGQHLLPEAFRAVPNGNPSTVWSQIETEFNAGPCNHLILSSETFDAFDAEMIRRLRQDYLMDFETTLIVYFRDPAAFLESAHKQQLKTGRWSGSVTAFIERNIHRCRYDLLKARWEAVFGPGLVLARNYEYAIRDGIVRDFLQCIGLPQFAPGADEPRVNRSQHYTTLPALRLLNRLTHKQHGVIHTLRRQVITQRGIGPLISFLANPLRKNPFTDKHRRYVSVKLSAASEDLESRSG